MLMNSLCGGAKLPVRLVPLVRSCQLLLTAAKGRLSCQEGLNNETDIDDRAVILVAMVLPSIGLVQVLKMESERSLSWVLAVRLVKKS